MSFHKTVLLQEAVDVLNVQKGGKYIDATVGGGGHAEEIIRRGGMVLGIDRDDDAILYLNEKFKGEQNFKVAKGNFGDIKQIAEREVFVNVEGIIFDLGVSSHQFEGSGRGFSFRKDEPLDMRMDVSQKLTADEIVNNWSRDELYELFLKMGEEHFASAITNNIIRARGVRPIKTSLELAKLIEEVVPRIGKIHPATKSFQALRIAVNGEMFNLKNGLKDGFENLKTGGRLSVITFHSLEDRIVKNMFRDMQIKKIGLEFNKKPLLPKEEEISQNPRARSAKLRVIERI